MATSEKPSYRSIVIDGGNLDDHKYVKEVAFTDFANLHIPSFMKMKNGIGSNKKEFLIDMLTEIASTTRYVKEHYGFHGVGDGLSVESVLDAFEKHVKVDVFSENEQEFISEEEEA